MTYRELQYYMLNNVSSTLKCLIVGGRSTKLGSEVSYSSFINLGVILGYPLIIIKCCMG